MSGRSIKLLLALSAFLVGAYAGTPTGARAQSGVAESNERDFIFTDEDGHLVLRFAGAGPAGPDPVELEEVINAAFSTMVHDRLRADLLFGAERVDPEWAEVMEPELRSQIAPIRHAFGEIEIECRARTCRMLMEHAAHGSVAEHSKLIDTVQQALEPMTQGSQARFEPIFLIGAYEQQFETPLIKVYLRRATTP